MAWERKDGQADESQLCHGPVEMTVGRGRRFLTEGKVLDSASATYKDEEKDPIWPIECLDDKRSAIFSSQCIIFASAWEERRDRRFGYQCLRKLFFELQSEPKCTNAFTGACCKLLPQKKQLFPSWMGEAGVKRPNVSTNSP